MKLAPLYLGEPPFDDVEAAAELWARYEADAKGGEIAPETFHMFMRMVQNPTAVRARAAELTESSRK